MRKSLSLKTLKMFQVGKKNKIIFASLVLLTLVTFFVVGVLSDFSFQKERKVELEIAGQKFKLEVVSSLEKMQKGLGERGDLCDFCGMLFDFKESGRHAFGMKGVKFPLDIVWILDGKVVYIERNVPSDLRTALNPEVDSNKVLELNAAVVDKLGLKVGDKINLLP